MPRVLHPGLLGLALLLAGGAAAREKPVNELSVEDVAREYRRLRAKKVEPGVFDVETMAFDGRKHELMRELVRRLGGHGTARTHIVELMGQPDRLVVGSDDDATWQLVESDRGRAESLLVYCWRGFHDFAWFGLRGGEVVSSGWWLAGE